MLGGPIGAALGAALGHNFDQGLGKVSAGGFNGDVERIQTAFFTATFTTMGHVAKADGQVSPHEIHVAEDVMRQMHLDTRQKKVAQGLFNEGKKGSIPINDLLHQFRIECHRRRSLLQMFMEIQVAVALSDGSLDARESRILENAADILGFNRAEYQAILQRMQAHRHAQSHQPGQSGMPLRDAYKLLGIEAGASDQEVKKAYRRQMNQHHPDKLVSRGLPEEMMEMANKKVQEIRMAYETIKASRKN